MKARIFNKLLNRILKEEAENGKREETGSHTVFSFMGAEYYVSKLGDDEFGCYRQNEFVPFKTIRL